MKKQKAIIPCYHRILMLKEIWDLKFTIYKCKKATAIALKCVPTDIGYLLTFLCIALYKNPRVYFVNPENTWLSA